MYSKTASTLVIIIIIIKIIKRGSDFFVLEHCRSSWPTYLKHSAVFTTEDTKDKDVAIVTGSLNGELKVP